MQSYSSLSSSSNIINNDWFQKKLVQTSDSFSGRKISSLSTLMLE